jgi:hypothetical protein
MKKRFLPFSLLLVIMILGQSVIADQGGHYVPRTQPTMNAESFMGSLRANQKTGLIDPADMLKALQAPATRNHADDPLYWISMGPDNMGGQTTAVLYDNQSNVVYIGSKGGGVYKTYNHGITWHQVGGLNLMVSCMVQDADGVIYVGTGDGNNGVAFNGLDQQGYENSFVGTGLYTLTNDSLNLLKAPSADEWLFINDLAIAGNQLLAATNEGLMCSNDKGHNWINVIEGKSVSVKVAADNTIVAVVENQVYIGKDVDHMVCHSGTSNTLEGDSLLPQPAGLVDIAIAPTNNDVIYVAGIDGSGNHTGVFVSEDKGETWAVAFPSVTSQQGHTLYNGFGLYNHGLIVDPANEGILYVLGYNLWSLQKPENGGFYLANQINTDSYIYYSDYLHVGIHTMVFNPNNNQECYIGTDGGVYKAIGRFIFSNCNRNYITTRMFNVAMSGKDTRILAAGLDHGTVLIEGDENSNTISSGLWINPSGSNMGLFNDDSHAGPCAISVLNPNTFFVTSKSGSLNRTETAGEDWVSTNFTSSSLGLSTTSFRLPILLYENYNNQLNPETAWYFNETDETQESGTDVLVLGANKFPFHYTLTAPLAAGDSIEVHDPVTATFFVAFTDNLSMTRTPLQFDVEAEWFKVADKPHTGFIGDPLSMAITADGDNMFVGMKNGRFYRVSGLNTVMDATSGSITDSLFAVTTTEIVLPIDGQCITSISVDPRNNNRVIVTCGNYGNDAYVFYSNNAMAAEPTFVSKQANLPKMPVYSSLIDMEKGHVILGTERGIYRTNNIDNPEWNYDGTAMGEVPVMELKQQILFHENEQIINVTEEGEFVKDYPGVYNTGIIYAATYGKGVFRCENYKKDFDDVPENAIVDNVNVSMYPNPVSSQATLSFDLKESCNVSYQVFDMTGRMVMNQGLGRFAEGEHQVSINAESLSAGSYILRLNQGVRNASVKFTVY